MLENKIDQVGVVARLSEAFEEIKAGPLNKDSDLVKFCTENAEFKKIFSDEMMPGMTPMFLAHPRTSFRLIFAIGVLCGQASSINSTCSDVEELNKLMKLE